MAGFVKKLLLFLAIQIMIAGPVYQLSVRKDRDLFFEEMINKEFRYLETPPDRLIILGGSNTPFGFESEKLKEELPFRPINLGLHAGLGTSFYMQQYISLASNHDDVEGDLVITAFEHHFFTKQPGPLPPVLIDQLQTYPDCWEYLTTKEKKLVFDNLLLLVGSRTRTAWFNTFALDKQTSTLTYRESSFNRYGEIKPNFRKGSKAPFLYRLIIDRHSVEKVVDEINTFHDMLAEQGTRMVFIFPPIPETAYDFEYDRLLLIQSVFDEKADFPVLNTVHEAVYPSELFYDTPYHMNEIGSTFRTEEAIRLVDKFLKDSDLQE